MSSVTGGGNDGPHTARMLFQSRGVGLLDSEIASLEHCDCVGEEGDPMVAAQQEAVAEDNPSWV